MRPLVRLAIARGVRFQELAEMLKEIYVAASLAHFQIGKKRLTDSRISLLTGLQRKDVRSLRERLTESRDESPDSAGAGLLPRVLAHWVTGASYCNSRGNPKVLPRIGDGKSFGTLVAEVSRDVHPRTVLDELMRLGLAEHDKDRDEVSLLETAFLPSRDETALFGYFGANLGDHAEAATRNLQAAPEPGPFFERAVHYNRLSQKSLDELNDLARQLQSDALSKLNARSLELQIRDAKLQDASGRFRCGAFIYHEDT